MSMDIVRHVRDLACTKRIAVIGDPMLDAWHSGEVSSCQDGCIKMPIYGAADVVRPGGAANAARSLLHWNCEVYLIGPWAHGRGNGFSTDLIFADCHRDDMIVKHRWIDRQGRIVFRADQEKHAYGAGAGQLQDWRELAVAAVKNMCFDAVLISDYDKGWLDEPTIQEIIRWCNQEGVSIVADAKQVPDIYRGSILKCNVEYRAKQGLLWPETGLGRFPSVVTTQGDQCPFAGTSRLDTYNSNVRCVNHIGAGDCFAAHMTLALACGCDLEQAAQLGHHAGRVYVQHPYNRPPWPHEIARDLDPRGGKVLLGALQALRESHSARVVVATNGIFRLLTPAHVQMLQWARQQGDVLVVCVNDDASVEAVRGNQWCLPLEDRITLLAALDCVDWIVPFSADTPEEVLQAIQPEVLVKGGEYEDEAVPGSQYAKEVRFSPQFGGLHVTQLLEGIRR